MFLLWGFSFASVFFALSTARAIADMKPTYGTPLWFHAYIWVVINSLILLCMLDCTYAAYLRFLAEINGSY